MNKPKKQHYVPQFYLKNFKDDSSNNNIINCFNIQIRKPYRTTIDKVAQKKFFYETSIRNLEYQLSQIEKESSKYINNLVKNKKYKYLNNLNIKANLSYYMSLQFIRTNDKREWIKNHSYKLKDEISQKIEIPLKFQQWVDEVPSKEHLKNWHLEYIEKFSVKFFKYFYYKKWILIKNSTKLNFWTSDNPISVWNPINPPGLAMKNTFIFFPLSPKLCICLANPFQFSNLNQIKTTSVESNILKATSFKFKDEIDVINNNLIQVDSCNMTVFSKDCDFETIMY